MEVLTEPRHKENILMALSQVPIATITQLSTLIDLTKAEKKTSSFLRELEQEKKVTWKWHGREKIWYLTKKARLLQKSTPMRLPTKTDHALAVINLYFGLGRPARWLYEPTEKFSHMAQESVWAPDCIFVHRKKVYVCEMQLTSLSQRDWAKKWSVFNTFFNHSHFQTAAFQQWSSNIIFPQFLVITSQPPETVKNGFEIQNRELIICREFK